MHLSTDKKKNASNSFGANLPSPFHCRFLSQFLEFDTALVRPCKETGGVTPSHLKKITRVSKEVHHFFSEVPQTSELKTSP